VEYFVSIFHEDDPVLRFVTLNSFAESDLSAEFVQAALVAIEDSCRFARASGAKLLGIARSNPQSKFIPEALWTQGERCLRAHLQDSCMFVRLEAALSLGRLSPTISNAQLVFPLLLSIVEDPEAELAYMRLTTRVISQFATTVPEEVIRIAPRLLQYPDSYAVGWSLAAIGQCGALATPILPMLTALADSHDRDINCSAKAALKRLGQEA